MKAFFAGVLCVALIFCAVSAIVWFFTEVVQVGPITQRQEIQTVTEGGITCAWLKGSAVRSCFPTPTKGPTP